MVFAANPFDRMAFTPPDGRGLNPQLQNPGMVIHPPMLYLGYISISIPFAFAIAALLSGRLDTGWIHAIRKWTLLCWLFLSIGITLGMWWAYVELGWGGYWAWDPVENASLLPWLTMTAFLHSVMIQEKRGMLKRWNMSLVVSDLPAQHLRHLHHPLGGHRERAQLRPVQRRVLLPGVPGGRGRVLVSPCSTPAGPGSRPMSSWNRW